MEEILSSGLFLRVLPSFSPPNKTICAGIPWDFYAISMKERRRYHDLYPTSAPKQDVVACLTLQNIALCHACCLFPSHPRPRTMSFPSAVQELYLRNSTLIGWALLRYFRWSLFSQRYHFDGWRGHGCGGGWKGKARTCDDGSFLHFL